MTSALLGFSRCAGVRQAPAYSVFGSERARRLVSEFLHTRFPFDAGLGERFLPKTASPVYFHQRGSQSATDDAESSCGTSDGDVWFEYIATCTGSVTVDTFGSGQLDTTLSVFDACAGNEIACDDDTNGTLSEVLFAVTVGQSYWIRLASAGTPGDYDLNVSCLEQSPIPSVSEWGLVVMTLLIVTAGTLVLGAPRDVATVTGHSN